MSGFKKELFNQFARVAKGLSNGNRLELLEFLSQAERSVDELARLSGMSVANTSQHLQQLRHAGLVMGRKEGQKVFYSLTGSDVERLCNALREVAERHLSEVRRLVASFLEVKDQLEPVPPEELLKRIHEGVVTVIDVRPPEEYAAGHLPGAINLPLSELEERLDELEPGKEVVAYCRGPHCVLAFDAVSLLREKGLEASRLDGGLPEWRMKGLPVHASH